MSSVAVTAHQEDAAPPHDSPVFTFSCTCLNIHVNGKAIKDASPGETTRRIWIGRGTEKIRHPGYIAWDKGDERSSRIDDGDVVWRKCWICDVLVYKVRKNQIKKEEAVGDFWALIDDSSGIISGQEELDISYSEFQQPFSEVILTLPSGISNFGRPPPSDPLPIYPPKPTSSPPPPTYLIPPVQDPFFLPPPFIPSNHHLRKLCSSAVSYLTDTHERLESDIKQYIAIRSGEMRRLEETVRKEVEVLWEKYRDGPGEAEAGRSQSGSRSKDERRGSSSGGMNSNAQRSFHASKGTNVTASSLGEKKRSKSGKGGESDVEVLQGGAGGGSLLSASLSANTFHGPPPPRDVKDEVEMTIGQLEKTHAKTSDARAVAMSYMFSALDDVMARGGGGSTSVTAAGAGTTVSKQEEVKEVGNKLGQNDRDSWIDGERRVLREGILGKTIEANKAESSAGPQGGDEVKEKRAVKFQEPSKTVTRSTEQEDGESAVDDNAEDDYVFDFELEERPAEEEPRPRQPNIIEENLSRTFAANAPSHRSAWKRPQGNASVLSSLRRDTTDLETDDEPAVSKLATSVPVNIAMPKRKGQSSTLPMERKTSLSDKGDVLVPSLIAAMRQRGLGDSSSNVAQSPTRILRFDPRHPVQQERRRSRSASISREAARSFAADPGAVFETLADEDEEEEEEGAGEGQGEDGVGTLREGTFVPPHIVVRREDRQAGAEVGWRSLVNE